MMIQLALLWTGWCVFHSLLITETVRTWFNRQGGLPLALYRMGYILFSILSLMPILWYQYSLPQHLLFDWRGWWRILQASLLLYAAVLFWYGKKSYDMDYFLGIRQWRAFRTGKRSESIPFRCSGILQYVRHPWYSGGIAVLWAAGSVTDAGLVGKSILTVYLCIGTLLEERKLRKKLGPPYSHYCRQVPMLIPWKGKVALIDSMTQAE